MSLHIDRRTALARLGAAAVAGWALARGGWTRPAPRAEDLRSLAGRLRDASRERAFEVAAEAIRAGATREAVLGAIFLAGVEDIRPRPHGILHAVMMVESAFQLAEAQASRARAAWHPVFFNLDDLKASQEEDRREWDDWRMQPLAAPRATADAARRELVAALEARDGGRAERAVVALHPHVDADAFFDLLRPISARCYAFLGHKAIYAVQVERVLRRIGWQHAEPALRSLVLALLVERNDEAYAAALSSGLGLPAHWQAGAGDADAALALHATLRRAPPREAREAVVAALKSGAGAAVAWDAILLLGSEVFGRRPGRRSADGRRALLPVHAFTVPSALRSSFLLARDDATRRLLLLQAATWTAALRDDLKRAVELSMDGAGLVAADSDEPGGLEALVAGGAPARALGYLGRSPQDAAAYLSRLELRLSERGREHHQHKYAAALREEAARVHPRLRPRLLAPALDYLAHPADETTDAFRRAERALDDAGVA